ncbi:MULTISPECIES: L,D-transpeptidase [Rhodomicrobium]|uniref:L,D-transpeptidase n=1 Tax=Rhodomicrobium TaxID=1068 RepID=UPI000B4A8F6A|nr:MULTISPECIES: L,D-transpeptidase [Rhodomicrobium]
MFKGFIRMAAFAAGAVALTVMGANSARADFLDDLFGGGPSYGGSKTMVRFSPKFNPGQIIVSFGDRRLYYVTQKGQAISYPIAIPKGEARWAGVLSVSAKKVNPDWTPTPEMRRENPKLPAYVPGGHPRNPLGVRALYLGSSLYRIHGTDAPWLIGQEVSKGCIRMHNADVVDLYNRANVGARVTVTWSRFNTSSS